MAKKTKKKKKKLQLGPVARRKVERRRVKRRGAPEFFSEIIRKAPKRKAAPGEAEGAAFAKPRERVTFAKKKKKAKKKGK